ncbi:MAG: GntR family transcriptional regulator [Pseudoflavonifractor sp.]|nr:GntR family transcriptional regulator [Pseudoflavonifractor sp.]
MPLPETVDDLKRQSAKGLIYQAICDWIITGVLQPGEKLLDSDVAKRFNVSRTPVREAFQLLEAQKLLQVVPGRFTVVTEIDRNDFEKCYRPLAEIQALAVFLACERLTSEDFLELDQIQLDFTTACAENRSTDAITCDNRFHEILIRASGNEYICDFSNMLLLHIQRIKYRYFHWNGMRSVSARQHQEILTALKQKDASLAQSLMREHWLSVMNLCLSSVLNPPESTESASLADQ